jgi:predicted RNase H-like HicB family nuclease
MGNQFAVETGALGVRDALDGPCAVGEHPARRPVMQFIAVLVPQPGGGWRAHFPDFPGCRAEGDRVNAAIEGAAHEVHLRVDQLKSSRKPIPTPRSYEEVRADDAWARARGIDWSTAVINLVRVG